MGCGRQRSKVETLLLHRCALRIACVASVFLLSSQLSPRTRAETLAMQVTLRKSHATDSQNTRDQITSDGRLKRSWSDLRSLHFIPFILNGRLNECC